MGEELAWPGQVPKPLAVQALLPYCSNLPDQAQVNQCVCVFGGGEREGHTTHQPLCDKAAWKPGKAGQVKAESCDPGGVSGDRLRHRGTKDSLEGPPPTRTQVSWGSTPSPRYPLYPQFTHTLAALKLLLTGLKPSVAGAGDSHNSAPLSSS